MRSAAVIGAAVGRGACLSGSAAGAPAPRAAAGASLVTRGASWAPAHAARTERAAAVRLGVEMRNTRSPMGGGTNA
jgi:hypothetical protein